VALAAGSDSPYGPSDPWLGIRAAVERRTAAGSPIGEGERLNPERALALYQGPLSDPGGPPARVAVGRPADLCLLGAPWNVARRELDRELVRATVVGGRVICEGER
jgi:predicted amidohydrolase YtcJ